MKCFYKKQLLVSLMIISTAAMMFAGCGDKSVQDTSETSQAIWETPPEETLGLEVETDYITLYYPRDWEEEVTPIQAEVNGNQVTTFRTKLFDQEIDLFSIILGPNEAEGYLLGQLKGEGEKLTNVYLEVNEQNPEDWTKEQYDEICALQERVNEITIRIQEDPRFIPNRA